MLSYLRESGVGLTKANAATVKQVRRRFPDAVLALTKAYSLAAASDAGKRLRGEVGFFQTVRAFLTKTSATKKSEAEKDFAVQQLVSRAVISTEIVDVLAVVVVEALDISILSDEFLAEVRAMDKKNLVSKRFGNY
jgi:type I restriction enzyme, R subunit